MPRRYIEALPRGIGLDVELLREVNRRIAELAAGFDAPLEYICECGDRTCERVTIKLELGEVQSIFDTPGCYLVAPGHDREGMELIRDGRGYQVVRRESEADRSSPSPDGRRD